MGSSGCVSMEGMDFTVCWKCLQSVLRKNKRKTKTWETRKHDAMSHVRLCTIKLQEVAFSSGSNHKILLLFWDVPGLQFDLG